MRFDALVFAAGFGTRLAPLTDEVPKPLVPIGDRPLLVTILENLLELGAAKLIVNTHYRALEIDNKIKSLESKVHVSHEQEILGTAGGLRKAAKLLGVDALVVVNGDIWGPLPVGLLLERRGTGLTLAVTSPAPVGQGTVGLSAAGEVVRLRGEEFGQEVRSGNYMGLAYADATCIQRLPPSGCLIGDHALPVLRSGGRIHAVMCPGDFLDIGSPESFALANMRWLKSEVAQGAPCFDAHTDSYLAPQTSVASEARVVGCVLGEGARVVGTGIVRDCIVFPGAVAVAPLDSAIVLPSGRTVPIRGEVLRGETFLAQN